MNGRADNKGSKSNVAINAWLPKASSFIPGWSSATRCPLPLPATRWLCAVADRSGGSHGFGRKTTTWRTLWTLMLNRHRLPHRCLQVPSRTPSEDFLTMSLVRPGQNPGMSGTAGQFWSSQNYATSNRERRQVKFGSVAWVGSTFCATIQLVPTFGTHFWV